MYYVYSGDQRCP